MCPKIQQRHLQPLPQGLVSRTYIWATDGLVWLQKGQYQVSQKLDRFLQIYQGLVATPYYPNSFWFVCLL